MRTRCSRCESKRLISFRTVKHEDFAEPGYHQCSRCNHVMPWHLEEGQQPLIGNNRQGRTRSQ